MSLQSRLLAKKGDTNTATVWFSLSGEGNISCGGYVSPSPTTAQESCQSTSPHDSPSELLAEGEVEPQKASFSPISKVKTVLLKQIPLSPLVLPPSLASVVSRGAMWRFFWASVSTLTRHFKKARPDVDLPRVKL